ncbi:hypothetical protein XU18_1578 [Perkinsela sp. CCAP 1560/4]|nr:hypothetical protein XU18_1578 [Perkinsela sp. CCAP 1560/4]|eukprot:KNH07768.1 hypothetical protein XU18_1578 [Perkinsela sp. CCAP 1560/4]
MGMSTKERIQQGSKLIPPYQKLFINFPRLIKEPANVSSAHPKVGHAQREAHVKRYIHMLPGGCIVTCPHCGIPLRACEEGPGENKWSETRMSNLAVSLQKATISCHGVVEPIQVMNLTVGNMTGFGYLCKCPIGLGMPINDCVNGVMAHRPTLRAKYAGLIHVYPRVHKWTGMCVFVIREQ